MIAFFAFLGIASFSAPALSVGRPAIVSVVGAVNDVIQKDGMEKNYREGAGLLMESELGRRTGLETGLLVMDRRYTVYNVQSVVRKLHAPLLARFWLSRFVSLGLGPYLALKVGDAESRLRDGTVLDGGEDLTSSGKRLEFGFEAAAAINVSFGSKSGIFIEARSAHFFFREKDETPDFFTGLVGVKIHL